MLPYEKVVTAYAHMKPRWPAKPQGAYAKLDSDYEFVLKIWSNYKSSIPNSQNIVGRLARTFSADFNCRSYKPLGFFRDLNVPGADVSRKGIYNAWVKRFTRDYDSGWHFSKTLLEVSIDQVEKVQATLGVKLSRDRIAACLALIFYNSAKGVVEEIRITNELIEKYSNDPRFYYVAAPNSMEKLDVDGLLKERGTGKIVHYVSIKVFGAFSMKTIKEYRNVKGKTTPTIYVGIHNEGDTGWTSVLAKNIPTK
jgi:hypothetical protein